MPKYEVGQELRVFVPRHNNRLPQSPEGGWPGVVAKVARKYMAVTIECYADGRTAQVTFDMETGHQRETSGSSNYCADVKTVQQVEESLRRKAALETLKGAGLELISYISQGRKDVSLAQLEALAEVITTHPSFTQEA